MAEITTAELTAMKEQVQQMISIVNRIPENHRARTKERADLLSAAQRLVQELKTPAETAMEIALQLPVQVACVRIAIRLRLFHILMEHPEDTCSIAELEEKSGADREFLSRIGRVLAAGGFIIARPGDRYQANSLTAGLCLPGHEAGIKFNHDYRNINTAAPDFFAQEGYRAPTGRTVHNFLRNTDETVYTWLSSNKEAYQDFGLWMSSKEMQSPGWVEWFPIQERLLHRNDMSIPPAGVLLVDIGGGKGQDLELFRDKFPDAKGTLILQDLDAVISKLDDDRGYEVMAHDFLSPQPVIGARIYYLHNVLHDWDDAHAIQILRNISNAMVPSGQSVLILNEAVLPNTDVSLADATLDFTMMCAFGARERSENDWKGIVERAGLELRGVWMPPFEGNGVLEVIRG
ncbi:MAG: hypothetical protein Q9222_000785 [Ikaeria aurantiellina]